MVWLHGGGFSFGSAASRLYDGARLAREGEVVLVSLNHRLGPFGFLDVSSIGGDDFANAGVVGMLDIVRALEWVRDNISQFGGDPGNVTVFGESGGAAKASLLLCMPSAQGLFHKAILQSAPRMSLPDREQAEQVCRELVQSLGRVGAPLSELQTIPAAHVLAAAALQQRSVLQAPFSPVIGAALPDPNVGKLHGDAIPIIVGSNAEETSLLLGLLDQRDGESAFALRQASLAPRLQALQLCADAELPDMIAQYKAAYPSACPSAIFFKITTDVLFANEVSRICEGRAVRGAAPTWVYDFTWRSSALGGKLGATHSLEIPLVFRNLDRGRSMLGDLAKARPLMEVMSSAWLNFAKTGDPGLGSAWLAYDLVKRPRMVFGGKRDCDDQEPLRG